jgi:hypothetical protein
MGSSSQLWSCARLARLMITMDLIVLNGRETPRNASPSAHNFDGFERNFQIIMPTGAMIWEFASLQPNHACLHDGGIQ